MKLCVNLSLLFTEHSLLDRFAAAKECEFNAVEIQFPYEAPAEDIRQRLEDAEQDLVLINVPAADLMDGGIGLASHPKRQEEFKYAVDQCAHYCESLGVERVNVLPGRHDPQFEKEQQYDTLLDNLYYCAEQLKHLNIETMFEAINTFDMDNFLIHRTDQMLQVVRDLNHTHVSMQYDLYHMGRMQEPIQQQLPAILEHIGHIQFADVPNRNQPGTGELPFEELMELLSGLNYQHWLGAEYRPSGPTRDSLEWKRWFEPKA